MNRPYTIIALLSCLHSPMGKSMEPAPAHHTFRLAGFDYIPVDAQRLLFSPRNQKWWYCSSMRGSDYNADCHRDCTNYQKVHSFNHYTAFLCFEKKAVLIHGNLTHEHIWFNHTSKINTACFNDDYVAIGAQDAQAHIFDMSTQKKLISFYHPHPVTAVALYENFLATASNKYAYAFDIKHMHTILSLEYDDEVKDIQFNKKLLTIASANNIYCIDISTRQKISSFTLDHLILSAHWSNNQLQVISEDKKNRSFTHYDSYTLDQLKLKWALNFWLLVEKPDQSILEKENLSIFVLLLLMDVSTKCNLPFEAIMEAWNTLPLALQVALYTTMRYKIRRHGKVVKKIIPAQKPSAAIQMPPKKNFCAIL